MMPEPRACRQADNSSFCSRSLFITLLRISTIVAPIWIWARVRFVVDDAKEVSESTETTSNLALDVKLQGAWLPHRHLQCVERSFQPMRNALRNGCSSELESRASPQTSTSGSHNGTGMSRCPTQTMIWFQKWRRRHQRKRRIKGIFCRF